MTADGGPSRPRLNRISAHVYWLGYGADVYLQAHSPQPTPRAEMARYAARLITIGREVERIGAPRQAVLQALEARLGAPPDDDDLAAAAAFLAGLGEPA